MTQPERFGGQAMGWDVLCGVSQRLTRADGAQGWVQAIMADHAKMLSTFPLQAQEDVWGKNPEAVMSASFDPKGIATPGRERLFVFRPVRLCQRHRPCGLADLRRVHCR